jgi:hypothetical protein
MKKDETGFPVYRLSYRLLIEIFNLTSNMKKSHKYTAGERLNNEALDLMINVSRANKVKEQRLEKITKAQENIEAIRIIFRLLLDTKQISLRRFVSVNEIIEDILKQLFGWQKSTR